MVLRVHKKLSPNDTGDTRSHQAGIHVPKGLVRFFPILNESSLNPRSNMRLQSEQGVTGMCTYIHYNNRVVSGGTRDEYRITRIRSFLSQIGAQTGDTIEFDRIGDCHYLVKVDLSQIQPVADAIVVDLAGGWKTVRA